MEKSKPRNYSPNKRLIIHEKLLALQIDLSYFKSMPIYIYLSQVYKFFSDIVSEKLNAVEENSWPDTVVSARFT